MNLPKSIQPDMLVLKEVPGDMTLKEFMEFWTRGPDFARLQGTTRGKLSIRFVRDGEPPVDYPDDTTLREFRRSGGRVIIDDGSGGVLAPA